MLASSNIYLCISPVSTLRAASQSTAFSHPTHSQSPHTAQKESDPRVAWLDKGRISLPGWSKIPPTLPSPHTLEGHCAAVGGRLPEEGITPGEHTWDKHTCGSTPEGAHMRNIPGMSMPGKAHSGIILRGAHWGAHLGNTSENTLGEAHLEEYNWGAQPESTPGEHT